MKEKGAKPTAEDSNHFWRRIVIVFIGAIIIFIEDLGVEEECHEELRKGEEAESTFHCPSASFQVHPKLSHFLGLRFKVFELFIILVLA